MAVLSPQETTAALNEFVSEKHLGILTLVRKDGRPHSTPVGFMWDDENKVVKIITWSGSLKTRQRELIPAAIEESLRYIGAVRTTARLAVEDIDFEGKFFPRKINRSPGNKGSGSGRNILIGSFINGVIVVTKVDQAPTANPDNSVTCAPATPIHYRYSLK